MLTVFLQASLKFEKAVSTTEGACALGGGRGLAASAPVPGNPETGKGQYDLLRYLPHDHDRSRRKCTRLGISKSGKPSFCHTSRARIINSLEGREMRPAATVWVASMTS